MKIRVMDPGGDTVGTCSVKPDGVVFRVTIRRTGREAISSVHGDRGECVAYVRTLAEYWKGQEPGRTIEEVED